MADYQASPEGGIQEAGQEVPVAAPVEEVSTETAASEDTTTVESTETPATETEESSDTEESEEGDAPESEEVAG